MFQKLTKKLSREKNCQLLNIEFFRQIAIFVLVLLSKMTIENGSNSENLQISKESTQTSVF